MHEIRRRALENWRGLVRKLDSLLADRSDDAEVAAMIDAVIPMGGTHQRAVLAPEVVRRHEADPRAIDAAAWAGLALELVHLGTIVHDDIIDGDLVRRDAPTAWSRFGIPAAVLLGDLLLELGHDALGHADVDDRTSRRLASEYSAAIRRCHTGQLGEEMLRSSGAVPTVEWCAANSVDKTGALFGFGFFAGVLLGVADDRRAAAAAQVGSALGECFQIADDIDDAVWNVSAERPGNDIVHGDPSWVVAAALDAVGSDATLLRAAWAGHTTSGSVTGVDTADLETATALAAVLDDTGAITHALGHYERRRETTVAAAASTDEIVSAVVAELLGPIDARVEMVRERGLSTTRPT